MELPFKLAYGTCIAITKSGAKLGRYPLGQVVKVSYLVARKLSIRKLKYQIAKRKHDHT